MANHEILILLGLVNVYLVLVYVLKRKGWLDRGGLSLFGPALMIRTKRGRSLIDRIAQNKGFWKRYGDVTIWTVVIFGVLMVGLLAVGIVASFSVPEGAEAGPREVLVIPGVNPWIPVGYGIMALAIGIVIHEFAHGILARAHDLKVKSLGLLVLVIPIGAFMEPDEEELHSSHPRAKTRVFAAGAGTSILVGLLFAAVYSYGFIPAAQPAAPGMGITTVSPASPAAEIGMAPGMMLVSVDGETIDSGAEFVEIFNGSEPGERVRLTVHSGGRDFVRNVTLVSRFDYEQRQLQRCLDGDTDEATCRERWDPDEEDRDRGFLGVGVLPPAGFLALHQPGPDIVGTLRYLFLPVQQFSPIKSPFANFYVIQGPLGLLGPNAFWLLANSVYWLFWINFLLGAFNALPLTVLDGGHVFNEGVRKVVRERRPEMPKEDVEERVQQASRLAAAFVVVALAAQLIIPWIL